MLFAFGARNYVESVRRCPHAAAQMIRLDLISDPPGATVVRERDGRPMCVTPCAVGIEAEHGSTAFRFKLDGRADRRVLVNMSGGDTRVEAVLEPEAARSLTSPPAPPRTP
jgi:hypothetical protein